MKKSIGIIGVTGRMGSILSDVIESDETYTVGSSFGKEVHKSSDKKISPPISDNIKSVFENNDYVVDFSSREITEQVFINCLHSSKPLVLCTTGWERSDHMNDLIIQVSKITPIVIASNTSLGACLQVYLVRQLAKILDADYDIDLIEKHHKHKTDIPSGTAISIINSIKKEKKENQDLDYTTSFDKGWRKNAININVQRSGNLPGEHEVVFTSDEEMISVKHVSFNRSLFAKGALKIVKWLDVKSPKSGLYTIEEVLGLL